MRFFLWSLLGLFISPLAFGQRGGMDSAVRPASQKYLYPSPLKRLMLGSNYRKEWATPVKLPVFYMSRSGLTIKELGGGQQTLSLQLIDKNGRGWVLRTIDKDVTKALPPSFNNPFIKGMTQDMISAAHPYIPLTIPTLSAALQITAPSPVIYHVADDAALGQYRKLFANTVCMLEEREPTIQGGETLNTEKLIAKLFKQGNHQLDQEALLRARLLDMLLGDWDRHADQWRWGSRDSAGSLIYYPIPRDRDQAYFQSNGLLVKFMQIFALRHLVSFNDDLIKIKSQNFKAWPFDRFFLNALDRDVWERNLRFAQTALTDDVIERSLKQLPPEIYAIRGKQLTHKMKGRRDDLLREGLDYYHFLSGKVSVYGTDASELFDVTQSGQLLVVRVYEYKDQKPGRLRYERRFDPVETFAVNLMGNKGDDHFVISKDVKTRIRITMAGEDGKDKFDVPPGKRFRIVD